MRAYAQSRSKKLYENKKLYEINEMWKKIWNKYCLHIHKHQNLKMKKL